jgi:hypothetical protein
MRAGIFTAGVLAAVLAAGAAKATQIPDGGLTLAEAASWLHDQGYAPEPETGIDGKQDLRFMYQGVRMGLYMYDCAGDRCGSLQFAVGWATHGKFDTSQMNRWNREKRWCRGYFDAENDPWLEMDVDLTPGGSYELLNDEFATFRNACLTEFQRMYDL